MQIAEDIFILFSRLIKSSKGRDKVCGLLQYLADFYHKCQKYSDIPEVQNLYMSNNIHSANLALELKQQLSQGRKIFRLFKFIGQIKRIKKISSGKKNLPVKILLIITHLLSFCYYVLDNSLLGLKILVKLKLINNEIEDIISSVKDNFTFYKNILTFFKNFTFVIVRLIKHSELYHIIQQLPDNKINFYNESYDICSALQRQKQKIRTESIDLFLSFLRTLMLLKKLKYLKVNKFLHPLFIACCGLLNCFISFMIQLIKEREEIKKKKPKNNSIKIPDTKNNESISIDKESMFDTDNNYDHSKYYNQVCNLKDRKLMQCSQIKKIFSQSNFQLSNEKNEKSKFQFSHLNLIEIKEKNVFDKKEINNNNNINQK